jgi:hypothetical protein
MLISLKGGSPNISGSSSRRSAGAGSAMAMATCGEDAALWRSRVFACFQQQKIVI